MFKALFALPRTVWLIGLISLINDSSSEMIYRVAQQIENMPAYLSKLFRLHRA